jgi:hypothetical protein
VEDLMLRFVLFAAVATVACMDRSMYQSDAYLLARGDDAMITDLLAVGDRLYWLTRQDDAGESALWRVDAAGEGKSERVASDAGNDGPPLFRRPVRLTATRHYLYWASFGDESLQNGVSGSVSRLPIGVGSEPERLPLTVEGGGGPAEDCAVSGNCFWHVCALAASEELVAWAGVAVSGQDKFARLWVLASGQTAAQRIDLSTQPGNLTTGTCTLAAKGSTVYWRSLDTNLRSVTCAPTCGAPSAPLSVADGQGEETQIHQQSTRKAAMQGDTLYFPAGTYVYSFDTLTSEVKRISTLDHSWAFAVAADAQNVYWTAGNQDSDEDNGLARHGHQAGGEAEKLAYGGVTAVALDADSIYYAQWDGIWRLDK